MEETKSIKKGFTSEHVAIISDLDVLSTFSDRGFGSVEDLQTGGLRGSVTNCQPGSEEAAGLSLGDASLQDPKFCFFLVCFL